MKRKLAVLACLYLLLSAVVPIVLGFGDWTGGGGGGGSTTDSAAVHTSQVGQPGGVGVVASAVRYTGAIGVGYTTATVAVSGGTAGAITANIVGGCVTSYTVTNAGSGYTQGTATATVSGDGSGALCTLSVSATGIIVSASPAANGLQTPYTSVRAALAAAQLGDTVLLSPGTFDLTSTSESTCMFITVPSGVILRGSGWGTIIYSSQRIDGVAQQSVAGTHCIVVLGNNCTVENLAIQAPWKADGSINGPQYGMIGNYTADSASTGWVIRNVWTRGMSDGFFIGNTASATTGSCYNCYFESIYDTVVVGGHNSTTVDFFNCTGYSHPPAALNDARGLVIHKGTARTYGGLYRAVNGNNANTGAYVDGTNCTLIAQGTRFQNDGSGTATIVAGVYAGSTAATLQLSGVSGNVVGGNVTWQDAAPHWVRCDVNLALMGSIGSGLNSVATTIYKLPAGSQVMAEKQKITLAAAPGDITTLTSSIGVAGNATKYSATFNDMAAVNTATFYANVGTESETATTNIQATFTSTGDTLDQLTDGTLTV